MKRQLRDFFKFAENLKNTPTTKTNYTSKLALLVFLFLSFNLMAQNPGFPFVDAGPDVELDCETPCTELSATFFDTGETTSYEVTEIDYAPPFPFTGGTSVSVNTDDVWSDIIPLPFDFCFFGETYTEFLIGSNGVVTFDTNSNSPGGFCPWSFSASLPSPDLISASINGAYMDINPAVAGSGIINFTFFGEAPARTLVVNFPDIPYFSCTDLTMTSQIVFYETTNIIDVYVENRPSGCTWNSGNAVIGIQNVGGTDGFVAPGRNTGDWSATEEAWRFTPNGESNVDFVWLDGDGIEIGNTAVLEVCPTEDTIYTARATYTNCNGDVVVEEDTVTVTTCEITEPDCLRIDFVEDFGTGVGRFETPFTNYIFDGVGEIDGGEYAISNTTAGMNVGWHLMTDHTGDPDGRMFVVNPLAPQGVDDELYRRTIDVLPNTDYTLSYFMTTVYNVDTNICPGTGDPSNILLRIEDVDGNLIVESGTGDVPNGSAPNWLEFSANFNSLDNTEIQFVFINLGINDCGNDLAIDDISLTYNSGPPLVVTPENITQCDITGTTSTFDLTTQIPVILDGQDPADFNVTFHLTEDEALTNTNPIATPDAYENTENPQTIYVRVEFADFPSCYSTVQFDLIVEPGIDLETNLPDSLSYCDNEPSQSLDATPTNPGIDLSLVTYEWFFDGELISQEAEITPATSGVYTVIILYDGCSELTVDIDVTIQEAPILDLGEDEILCDGNSIEIVPIISGNSANTTYLWSTGETTSTIVVNTSGTYTLEITDGLCIVSDEITITFGDLPSVELGPTIFTCPNETQTIVAITDAVDATFVWFEDGVEITGETGNSLTIVVPQSISTSSIIYGVEVTVNGCSTTAEVLVSAFPNNPNCVISEGLSPDGSIGFNDNLDLEFLASRTGIANLQILNRHGREVYSLDNYVNQWAGQTDEGDKLPTGTYFYILSFAGEDPVYGTQKTGWIYINRDSN
ncbi:MAG: gliding motility-associated C-terminal domain-containing protein [Flavobacteriaceae bacterium]